MQNENTQTTVTDKINEFIKRNRTGIYIFLGAIVFLFTGLIVYLSLNSYFQRKATAEVEELNSKYIELRLLLSDDHYNDDVDALIKDLTTFAKGKTSYAGARAWTIIAQIHSEKKEWPHAEEAWRNAAKAGVKTYLAPVAFFNAAVAAENQGNPEDAIELLEKCVSYKLDFPSAPRAQFSIGRLNEQLGNYSAAAEAYRAVLVNWPNIEIWVNLAQSRLAVIEE
ncbi:MAG: tetratricopeptide repeat protein [Treponema sp.]|jgi:tetratricopeptide (TPR) repeat protein|nr:tetratricopeptide repeat protein [Treponema sp.]